MLLEEGKLMLCNHELQPCTMCGAWTRTKRSQSAFSEADGSPAVESWCNAMQLLLSHAFILPSRGHSEFGWHCQELMDPQPKESICHCPNCFLLAEEPSAFDNVIQTHPVP